MNPSTQPSARDTRSSRGVAAMWLVLMMGLFMGFAAMAVDLGQWYITKTRVQTATDAAALAGAALLPDDPALAIAEAIRVAGQHGYDPSAVTINLAGGSQLEVDIDANVTNVFLPAIGFANTTLVGGHAIAEYEGSVSMGSPDSQLGSDPERLGEAGFTQDDFSLGIASSKAWKDNGDRFHVPQCRLPGDSYCTSGVNDEYRPDGYFYKITVEALHGEDLLIEVFDPAWVGLDGSDCRRGGLWNSSLGIAHEAYNEGYQGPDFGSTFYSSSVGLPTPDEAVWLRNLTDSGSYSEGGRSIPQGWYDTAEDRYYPGDVGNAGYWCVGDSLNGVYDNGGTIERLETTYLVREPDNTPWNNLDNDVVLSAECSPSRFPAWDFSDRYSFDNRVMDLLSPPSGPWDEENGTGSQPDEDQWWVDETDGVHTFAEYFRRWTKVCRIDSSDLEVGEYLLQVRTNASAGDPIVADLSLDTRGSNKFSLRAGFDTSSGLDNLNDVKVAAAGRLPVFVNLESATTEFFIARVLPTARERTLTVELFDIGESSGSGDYVQILPPDDPTAPNEFSDCEFTLEGGGSLNTSSSICRLYFSGTSPLQGKAVIIDIPIPDDYDCDATAEDGCWARIGMDVQGASDFTTWSAYISGDPVRLIE